IDAGTSQKSIAPPSRGKQTKITSLLSGFHLEDELPARCLSKNQSTLMKLCGYFVTMSDNVPISCDVLRNASFSTSECSHTRLPGFPVSGRHADYLFITTS